MDRGKAKFVLQSFRPDGADANDADFAEALKLATQDRELGEWLVRERAFDAEFAEALARVNLPDGLRENILLSMVQDGRDFPAVDMMEEGKWINAMAGINVPGDLRERVLTAMEQTAKVHKSSFGWKRVSIPLAAAAGITLAFVAMRDDSVVPDSYQADNDSTSVEDVSGKISAEAVAVGFVRTFESPIFSLDKMSSDLPDLVSYIRENDLPFGEGYRPPGLNETTGLGCREITIDGVKGSLICFDEKSGTVHVVILRKEDVQGDFPGIEKPMINQSGDWASASWEKDEYVFTMMSLRDKTQLEALF